MKTKEVQELYQQFVMPTYTRVPVCLVKGKGSRVWDLGGKEYLDFFPGWGVSALGHCHPAVVNAIKEQARKMLHVANNFLNIKQAELARMISEVSFPSRIFFCNSGAEANEGAIKFAKKYGGETGRYEIITMKKSFHGRTLAAMKATGQEKFHQGFEPLLDALKILFDRIARHIDPAARIETATCHDEIIFNIIGDGSGIFIGKKGQTLEALQYLLNKIRTRQSADMPHIIVDSEGYRSRHIENLESLALRLSEKAKKKSGPIATPPLNSSDRRIIHMKLKQDPDLTTWSKGDGSMRKVVIAPRQ